MGGQELERGLRISCTLGTGCVETGVWSARWGERVKESWKTAEAVKTITRNRNVRMEVKKTLHDSVLMSTLTYRI